MQRDYEITIGSAQGLKSARIISGSAQAVWVWANGFRKHTERKTGVRWELLAVNSVPGTEKPAVAFRVES